MENRIIFMGSPDFALLSLKALADYFNIIGVVTQPDRPSGRGRKLTPPPVKVLAETLEIPVIQPSKLRTDITAKNQLHQWEPDVIVVAAFGQILEADILELAPYGCVNVHASLLPRWRGVSPIQAAILNGDSETGITIMKMDEGIDTGPIISQRVIRIKPDETGGSLSRKLAELGADLLIDTLPNYLNGNVTPNPQDKSPTPYAPMLRKSDGELNFQQTASYLSRQVRAYNPWPGTFTIWMDRTLKIHKAHAFVRSSPGAGVFTTVQELPAIGTSDGLLVLEEVQPSGKLPMSGKDFLRGARQWK